MRILVVLALTSLLTNCKQQQQEATNTPQEIIDVSYFSGEWQMLTEQNDSLIIYRPCDADNVMLQLHSDTLVIGWGQDASGGIVTDFQKQPDGRFSLVMKSLDSDYSQKIMVQVEDPFHGLARWWIWDDGSEALFVQAKHAKTYPYIIQPCHECWEDCPDE